MHPRAKDGSSSSRQASLLAAAFLCVAIAQNPAPASADVPTYERVRVLETPRPIGDTALTDQNGGTFRLSDLRGRVAFVLFGFTNCPDACPLSMERLRELQHTGQVAASDVAYVMISVDGERDTPAAMKAFLAKYSSDFIGLTAEPSRVNPVAQQFNAMFFKGSRHAHDGGYEVAHSPQIFVLDPKGRLRAEVYSASLEAMAGVANALLREEETAP
jgi:protein SCO1/2